jgi:hypothetical protein
VRFRRDSRRLFLGLLVTDPRVEEGRAAARLYDGARAMALSLGLREILVRTSRHGSVAREAGYRRCEDGWRLEVAGAGRRRDAGGT